MQQNTELVGIFSLFGNSSIYIYKRAQEESDSKNVVIDTSNKDINTEKESHLEKKD